MVGVLNRQDSEALEALGGTCPHHVKDCRREEGGTRGGQALEASAMREGDSHVLSGECLPNMCSSPRPRTAATSSVQLLST